MGRKKRSFVDERRALVEARATAQQLNSGRIDTAEMTSAQREEWQVAREIAGVIPLVTAIQEWARARELAKGNLLAVVEQWAQRQQTRGKPITVNRAINLYLKARRADGVKVERSALQTFEPKRVPEGRRAFREVFGGRLITEVTANELAAWLEAFAHPATRNTNRKRIVALWRWCQRRGFLPEDVTTAAERTDRVREQASKIEIISAADLARSFAITSEKCPHNLAALALAAFCGMRRGEVHGQVWEDIDVRRGFLRVTSTKPGTPSRRNVPLTDTAKAWLEPLQQRSGLVSHSLSLDHVRRACREDGLRLAANGFRHSWISAMVELSGDIPRTALNAGTSVDIVHKHYRQLLTPEEAAAWFAVLPIG